MDRTHLQTLVIGGGPAGISLLLSARRNGILGKVIRSGIAFLEKTSRLGPGELGSYVIRSDSFADSFITSPNAPGDPQLQHLLNSYPGKKLNELRGKPVELTVVAEYLASIGREFFKWDRDNRLDLFNTETTAIGASLDSAGLWTTEYRDKNNNFQELVSRSIVLTTGANQSMDSLHNIKICNELLLPEYKDKIILSKDALATTGPRLLESRLKYSDRPRVVIIGGSHSAVSAANVCLTLLDEVKTDDMLITVLHKDKLAITYQTPQAAHADGYTDFGPDDICPVSGRVYPLAGFRSDSRELMRRIWGLGGQLPETRVRLLKLQSSSCPQVRALLSRADIIITALGYRPRALPLFDHMGKRISLKSELTQNAPLVDHKSRILDKNNAPVNNAYCMGLSAGYPMAGRYGEPSFRQQANGLSLWQSDIGAEILEQIIG